MSRLLYAPAAKADLDDIWTYTVERWGASQAASYVREIDAVCHALAAGTRSSVAIDEIRPRYRKAFVRRHAVFFRLNEAGETVVVRILHQSRDVPRHLPSDR